MLAKQGAWCGDTARARADAQVLPSPGAPPNNTGVGPRQELAHAQDAIDAGAKDETIH